MTFVSHAQNFEDVILWRALKHVQNGRYIDIGAWEPEIDSVSKAFYDQGWRGVHVEPIPVYAEKLRQARPDEVVIEAAVGLGGGQVEITVIEDTGLSTGHAEIADLHSSLPFTQKKINVLKMSLLELFEAQAIVDIHWLKIDVEGMEEEVLRSWEGHSARPWILVLESTLPNSPEQNHSIWESEVVARGYSFAYFDGLNRFYVHERHSELLSMFGPGPNVFDQFLLSPNAWLMRSSLGLLGWDAKKSALKDELRRSIGFKESAEIKTINLEKELTLTRSELSTLSSRVLESDAFILDQKEAIELLQSAKENLVEQLKQSSIVAEKAREKIEMIENSMFWRFNAFFRR
jgi:FkbM family methyltransferase